jgi:mannose/cellobiose epimerase-like protein (N-acyl-D-glucosamine 2-epimerase family)
MKFQRKLLPSYPNAEQIKTIVPDCQAIVLSNLQLIVDRSSNISDYRWVDTKLSLITGQDFVGHDVLHSRDTVYGWIQGRAVEALAEHARWIDECDIKKPALKNSIVNILIKLLCGIRNATQNNGGHLFFFMTRQGQPFLFDGGNNIKLLKLTDQSPYNFSDLFAAKGLYVAGQYLQDKIVIAEAKRYCLDLIDAVFTDNFASDQQQLDPLNPCTHQAGRHSQGPYMLMIGIACQLVKYEKDRASVEVGLRLIRHIIGKHININSRWSELGECDFVEYIDNSGKPYQDQGLVISDPGHALEFVGLTLKFVSLVKKLGLIDRENEAEIHEIEALMPVILKLNFSNGFRNPPGGICKSFDLITRKAVNKNMPWWNLPETIRASIETWAVVGDERTKEYCLDVLSKCYNAFIKNYVKPELALMQIQTLCENGQAADVIPAVPDADPCYHTGLCLIDFLRIIESGKA